MKFKLFASLGLLAFASVSAQADTNVATFGTPPSAYAGCYWTLTSSSGGGGAPQWYTLACPGDSNVVGLMTTGGGSSATCTITSAVKAGYVAVGSGCSTQINKVVTTPQQCTNANKGKVYYSGPSYIAQSILQGTAAQSFCGDCKVDVAGSSAYGSTQTISCSIYKN